MIVVEPPHAKAKPAAGSGSPPSAIVGRRLGAARAFLMSNLYDLMLLLDADAPSERREEILTEVESAISSAGSVESKHDWGVRKLAYEIDHRTEAGYHLLQFVGSRELLESLGRLLKLTDGIVRFRIIKVKPGTPAPPAVRSEAPSGEPTQAPTAA